jgi:CRP-like cAMP-binding protein
MDSQISCLNAFQRPIRFNEQGYIHALTGQEKCYAAGSHLFHEGDAASHAFKLNCGTVKLYKIEGGTGRQIIEAFAMPGDWVGLEFNHVQEYSAVAIDHVRVVAACVATLRSAAAKNCETCQALLKLSWKELRHARRRGMLLGMQSEQRLAVFLLEMSTRLSEAHSFDLPMSREDIAGYLGLRIETVSRAFTKFEEAGLIVVGRRSARRIVLDSPAALERMIS